jgi:hypothetical protein
MIRFTATILKFGEMGEKTGWCYITISAKQAKALKHDSKKSFRVKGKLDELEINGMALMPMGDGSFIMALKADVRKAIKKQKGATINVQIEKDETVFTISPLFAQCLHDEPKALSYFNQLPKSHQKYYDNWINSAKTEETKVRRIAKAVTALSRNMHYGEMIRSLKEEKDKLNG